MYEFYKTIHIKGLRFPKIIIKDNTIYLFGGILRKEQNDVKKYTTVLYKLNNNFEIIEKSKKLLNFENFIKTSFEDLFISYWLRDIYIKNSSFFLLMEFKFNNHNKNYKHKNFLFSTNNFDNFKIEKEFDLDEYFIFKEFNNIIFSSKIINDDNFFWGKYLFRFHLNGNEYEPKFDIDLIKNNFTGQLIHDIIQKNDNYIFLLSFREKLKDNKYKYLIYTSQTTDFKNFYNTKEVNIYEKEKYSSWFSYPSIFYNENDTYLLCNTDDFGKYSNPIIFIKK